MASGSVPTPRSARGPGSQAPSTPLAEDPACRPRPSHSPPRQEGRAPRPGHRDRTCACQLLPRSIPGSTPTPASHQVSAPAPRTAAGLAPGDSGGGGSRPRSNRGTRGAGGRGRRAARPAGGPAERRRRRHGRGCRRGLRAPGSPPGPARSRRAAAAVQTARREANPATGATCLGPSVRRGGGARRGRAGAGEACGRDASGQRPPRAAPRRAAPQPVPPARVPGPLPHRAGARGHADGARMPHRGRQLRGAGAHHLGPCPPLLPLLGRLLGECPRPGAHRAPGGVADRRSEGAKFGAGTRRRAAAARVRFKTPGRTTLGPRLISRRSGSVFLPFLLCWFPELLFFQETEAKHSTSAEPATAGGAAE